MKSFLIFCLLVVSFKGFAANEAKKEKPLNYILSDRDAREILANEDAKAIRKAKSLTPEQFAELMRKKGGNGKGETFLSLDLSDKEMIALAAATSLGLIVFHNDEQIMDFVQKERNEVPQGVEDFGNFIGSRTGNASIMAGSYFLGVVLQNNKLKRVGLVSVAAGIATAIVTEAFKVSYGRYRPIAGKGAYEFFGEGKSFFSGHTSSVFSMATVISEIYGDEHPIVPWLAYGVATITAYSRMRAQAHWGSDVLAGAIAGVLVTKIIYHYMDKKFTDKKGTTYLSFYPTVDLEKKGFNMKMTYIPKSWR